MTFLLIDEKQERGRGRPSFQIPDDCKTLLIGEGRNDARFLTALARSRHAGSNAAAYGHWIGGSDQKGKISELNDDLNSAVKSGGFLRLRSFALVLDADQQGMAALKKINQSMKACFEVAADFVHGEVRPLTVRGEEILAGAFVMPGSGPDGEIKGALEDLVLRAAEQKHKKEMECVRKFRECAQGIDNKPKKEQDEKKKKAQALLSALPRNSPYLGTAAQDGLVDFSAPAYGELKKFLKKLAP